MVNLYEYLHNGKDSKKNAGKAGKMNESKFDDWKRVNTPKFDVDKYKTYLEGFCRAIAKYVNAKSFEHVNFSHPTKTGNNVVYRVDATWSANNKVTPDKTPIIVEKLKKTYEGLFKENFAVGMPKTRIEIRIPEKMNGANNELYSFVDSMVERINGKSLDGYDYIKVKNLLNYGEESGYVLYFDIDDFMTHYNEIVEIF